MNKLLIVIFLACIVAATASADKTRRHGIKVRPGIAVDTVLAPVPAIEYDTVTVGVDSLVRRSGFDKPASSRYETMFVTNNLDRQLLALEITFVYTDLKGRQLHTAIRLIKCSIPPGETRSVTFPSWDKQGSFYYKLSRKSRRSEATAFDVVTRVDRVVLMPAK